MGKVKKELKGPQGSRGKVGVAQMKKNLDDLSGEPVLVPQRVFHRSVRLLKRVLKQLNGISWGVIEIREVREAIRDLEHSAKMFTQR